MTGPRSLSNRALLNVLGLAAIEALLLFLLPIVVHAQIPQRAILARVQPEYPALARRMHITGSVIVQASIEPSGSVSEAHATSGHALLQPSAQEAVLHWKFAPGPSVTNTLVEIRFAHDPKEDGGR